MAEIRLDTLKPEYYHFEFVDIRLRARDPGVLSAPLSAEVLRDGIAVETIGGLTRVPLQWDGSQRALIGHWPCPWNAPEGEYQLALVGGPAGLRERLKVRPFAVARRRPNPLPRRFVALTMENSRPLATMKVKTPDGGVSDWRGLLDWAQFLGADAFWLLAGQTPGDRPGEVWLSFNLPMIPRIARECRRRGIRFGVYAQCYLTMSQERLARYEYAEDVEDGRPVLTRAVSLRDSRRPKDVADFLADLKAIPGVDWVGLDYLRNALGGYELVEDFFREMTWVARPAGFDRLSRAQRMAAFARRKIARKDAAFIDAWQWWRARRAALIVREIRRRLGDEVPLWAFTLTWQKGWQHGQDSVMMNDAGVDADALMMYEADAAQFEQMMKDWNAYAGRRDVQLVVGDVLDWPLHQRSPRGPGEFVYRMERAINKVYRDDYAAGIFIHDLDRALRGRLGPYSTLDWMRAAKSVAAYYRSLPDRPVSTGPGPRAGLPSLTGRRY